MSEIILKAENISKQYRLGLIGTGTISHDLNRWWSKVRGKDDPFLKVGEINDRSTKGESDYVWALRDINFEVKRGEVLGIIGKNGAGKSTLLKILSRVTSPTTGEIKTKGRIASLLEVGTGFHPEMTGRENIYLNGAILGMTKAEIRSKIDEIIEFSGCERYIDTPVKRYSSGMRVRLAFAVAAHLEPDILIIDEVLAVGDAEFQKKAIGKMQDISKGDGRTVLFVSHNMAAVKSLCSRGILMDQGKVVFEGDVNECINFYGSRKTSINKFAHKKKTHILDNVRILDIKILNQYGEKITTVFSGNKIVFKFKILKENFKDPIDLGIGFYSSDDTPQFHCSTEVIKKPYVLDSDEFLSTLIIEKWPLIEGDFYINVYIRSRQKLLDYIKEAMWIECEKGDYFNTGVVPSWRVGFYCDYDWK